MSLVTDRWTWTIRYLTDTKRGEADGMSNKIGVSSDPSIDENDDILSKMLNFLKKIPAAGIILSATSGFCLAAASLIVKKTPNVNSVQIFVSRAVVQVIFFLPFIIYTSCPSLASVGSLSRFSHVDSSMLVRWHFLPTDPSNRRFDHHFFCSCLCDHHSLHLTERTMRSDTSYWRRLAFRE